MSAACLARSLPPRPSVVASRASKGLVLATASAAAFGLSGSLGKGLIDAGWSPAAAVIARILGGAIVLAVPAWVTLRGRWSVLRRNAGFLTGYGVAAVAMTQLFFFNAVSHIPVATALLIECTAPVAIVVWLWLRHGHVPTRLTVVGGGLTVAGLVLLLDLGEATSITLPGVLWALGAMAGSATYFVLSADNDSEVPPLVLAWSGLVLGGATIAVSGLVGLAPLVTTTAPVHLLDSGTPWWIAVAGLAVVTAALAYTTGIAAGRRLGARLASFVALSEVVMAVGFAWLLVDQIPMPIQAAGGALVLGGVLTVKAGEAPLPTDDASEVNPPSSVAA